MTNPEDFRLPWKIEQCANCVRAGYLQGNNCMAIRDADGNRVSDGRIMRRFEQMAATDGTTP